MPKPKSPRRKIALSPYNHAARPIRTASIMTKSLKMWNKEVGIDREFKILFIYSNETTSGLKELYPTSEIIARPNKERHRDLGKIMTCTNSCAHIMGNVNNRRHWWPRWTETCGWIH